MCEIEKNVEIDLSYISWAEYQLFVDEWFSTGERFRAGSAQQPVTGVSWENVLRFCVWLSTKSLRRWGWRRKRSKRYIIDCLQKLKFKIIRLGNIPNSDVGVTKKRIIKPREFESLKTQIRSLFEFEVVTVNAEGQEIQRERCVSPYFTEDLSNSVTLEMVAVPGGTFNMGAPDDEEGSRSYEYPQHEVAVQPFFMGKYPITQAQLESHCQSQGFESQTRP